MMLDTRGQKILVAENDRTVLEMLQIRLDLAGYDTLTARTGAAALEILETMQPAVMVLELRLPDMDGFKLMRAIHTGGGRFPIPTLLVGRNLSPDDIQTGVKLGVRDIVTKPFSGAHMVERVSRLLKRPEPQAKMAEVYI